MDIVSFIVDSAKNNNKTKVHYVNLHALNISFECPRFRNILRDADLVFCDGIGVLIIANLLGKKLNYRNTPPDWLDDLAAHASNNGVGLFLLGDETGIASMAAEKMKRIHPSLKIVGTHHGYFNQFNKQNDSVIAKINAASPDILIVGMGMRTQEFWIDDNINKLNAKAYLTVGAAFRYYSGIEKRAPEWVTSNGLEWLSRLVVHPVKHFRRYIIGIPKIITRLIKTEVLNYKLPEVCGKHLTKDCYKQCPIEK
jgi:N-acetylglucosaminyldiphosphoundecaprenol N-acetyl-beta-D-mannosaminyltransferase